MAIFFQHPESIFSEEVWAIIIGRLDDPVDVLNLFKACPKLGIWFQKRKHLWLFYQVLPLLIRHLQKRSYFEMLPNSQNSHSDFQVQHYVKRRVSPDLLSCRQVCKLWRRQISTYLVGETFDLPHELKNDDNIRKFLEFLDNSSIFDDINPLICPYLKMVTPSENAENYWTLALILFAKFGRHIKAIQLHVRCCSTIQNFCEMTLNCLQLLPNLKSLELNDGYLEMSFRPYNRSNEDIEYFLQSRRQQLLHLSGIEQLDLIGVSVGPQILPNFWISLSCANLRKIMIVQKQWDPRMEDLDFQKLTELKVVQVTSKNRLEKMMESLGRNAKNLRELEIELNLRLEFDLGENFDICAMVLGDRDLVRWLKLFPKIQKFKVDCRQTFIRETGMFSSEKDSIPSLKSFEMQLKNNLKLEYAFLECFTGLEELKLINENMTGNKISQLKKDILIDFGGKDDNAEKFNMYDSKIWRILPKLEVIHLQGYQTTTREMGPEPGVFSTTFQRIYSSSYNRKGYKKHLAKTG